VAISFLGGGPIKIADDVDSPVTFDPAGGSLCVAHSQKQLLVVADRDSEPGTGRAAVGGPVQ